MSNSTEKTEQTLLDILKMFVISNLQFLRTNIIKKTVKYTDKDTKETTFEDIMRIPYFSIGEGSGNFKKYEDIAEFTSKDGKIYVIQFRGDSRVVLKDSINTVKTPKQETMSL